jgi:hypothetical protein
MISFHELTHEKLKEASYMALREVLIKFQNDYKKEHSYRPDLLELIEKNMLGKQEHIQILKKIFLSQQYSYQQSSELAQEHFSFYLAQELFYENVRQNQAYHVMGWLTHPNTPANATWDGQWAVRHCCLHGFTDTYQTILQHGKIDIHFEDNVALRISIGYKHTEMIFMSIQYVLEHSPENISIYENIFKELKCPQYQIMINNIRLFNQLSAQYESSSNLENKPEVKSSTLKI